MHFEQFMEHVKFPEELLEYEFLFGIEGDSLQDQRLNYILLLGKFFVYREKVFNQGDLDVYKFLAEF